MADTDSGTLAEAPPAVAPEAAAPEAALQETASSPADEDEPPPAPAPEARAPEPEDEAPEAKAPVVAEAKAPRPAKAPKPAKRPELTPAKGVEKAKAERTPAKGVSDRQPPPSKAVSDELTPPKGVSDRLAPPKGVSDRQAPAKAVSDRQPAKGASGRHVALEATPSRGISGRAPTPRSGVPLPRRSDTARKGRPGAPGAPRGAYVAAAVIIGSALLVVAALAVTGGARKAPAPVADAKSATLTVPSITLPALPPPERPRAGDEAPAASWRRLNALQERLAGEQTPTLDELDRLRSESVALRASAISREAAGALDRVERRLAELAAAAEGAKAPDAPAPASSGGDAKAARLASIDAGLEELAFAVEARLNAALASSPDCLLLVMAEEQQGRGARDRLRKAVREAKSSPRALIDVALRPEWVGLLGSSGYRAIEDWAEQYLGAFAGSEAHTYWQEEHRPRLADSLARARQFEAALAKLEAAWKARDHAAGVAALAAYRDARTDIWGPALLACVDTPEAAKVWGSIPLRPEDLARDAPAPRDAPPPAQRGSGTGFFVEPHLILTNAHVVGTAAEVTVQLQGKADAKGKVLARDAALDLALIEVPGLDGQPLALCKDSISVGESVYVYGYGAMVTTKGMLTNDQAVWTEGSLSQVQKDDARRLLVVTAAVNPGNSGGPLVDCGGNWIGVVVAKTRTEGAIEGYGFAIHGEDAMAWIKGQKARNGFKTSAPPRSPLRPSAIAKRLPVSVVRIVVGG